MRHAVADALRHFADRPALIAETGEVWTYSRLEAEARAIAVGLTTQSLVVIEGTNSPATIAAYLGVMMTGGLVHLTEPGRSDALSRSFAPLIRISCDGTAKIEADALGGTRQPIHPDLVLLFSTSGTTGVSKLVKLTDRNILSNTESIITYLDLTAGDRAITSLKPSYAFGLSVINSHLLCGGTLLLTDRSVQDPAFWAFAREGGATSLAGVPHTYEVLANDDSLEKLSSLRLLVQAGGRLRPELVSGFAKRGRHAGWRFCVMYGQTEASPRMAYLPPEMAETAPEAIGVAIPGGELTIEDESGHAIETPGVEGELIYRGPNVMAGYATSRSDLASATPLGRLATGDLARRRYDGLFVITGRRSRFIKPLGRRIGLDDVEQILAGRGVIAAAIAQGEGLLVVHEDAKPISTAELAAELGLPRALVTTRNARLPRLASGKVNYLALESVTKKRVWLPTHLPCFIHEMTIEAWRLLVGGAVQTNDFVQIFSEVMQRRVVPTDSFLSLGADSLNYVELSIALEDAFGELPTGWTRMTIGQLEQWLQARS